MLDFLNKNKPVKIRFYFDRDTNKKRFTVYDQITMERARNGERSTERFIVLMSHFMVDDKNEPIPEDKAQRTLVNLTAEDFEKVRDQFVEGMEQAAIPKANGSGSNSTSTAGSEETLPNGSLP